jgi:predicted RND superfamily exporter protein
MARLEREVDRLNGAYPSLEMRVAGLTVVATEASLGMLSDLTRSLGTAAAVILILVVVVLRSVRLGLVCIVPNLLPLLGVAGVLGLTGTPLQYSGIAVLTVGLGLAVDDSLHMVAAYRRSRDELGVRAAVRSAAHKVGGALCATTALLGAGLASVGLSSVPTIRQFGLLMCVLLAFALLADLVVLPASLVGLRRRGS